MRLLPLFGALLLGAQVFSSNPVVWAGEATSENGVTREPRKKASAVPSDTAVGTLPPAVGRPVGQSAPNALVLDVKGSEVSLDQLYRNGAVLVVFYRGGWCPYCNFQVHDFSQRAAEFSARGVTPVLISVDRPEAAAVTQAAYTVPFPLLADPTLQAHRAFGVVYEANEAEVARLKGFGIDLEAASGQTHHSYAVPSMFLIDAQGQIRWAHAELDYKVRPSTDQVLAAIDRVGLRAPPSR